MPPIDFYSCYVIEETDVPTRVFPSLNLFQESGAEYMLELPLKTDRIFFDPLFSFAGAVMPAAGRDDEAFRTQPARRSSPDVAV